MDIRLILTESEQRLLGSAFSILSENLAEFLLSGLGENDRTTHRTFIARSANSRDVNANFQFVMINESEQGLPRGRDPLIFAAMLDLLWADKPPNGKVSFQDAGLLKKLQWPINPQSKLILKQAIDRYMRTAYYLIDTDLPEEERIEGPYSRCRRLLTGYETTFEGSSSTRASRRSLISVQFFPDFLSDITNDWKQFLGIGFERLHSIQQILPESNDSD
jgi:hypothetical protein